MISSYLSLITTDLSWENLVLDEEIMKQVDGIKTWLKHSSPAVPDGSAEKKMKPGYRSLFYGPPGSGKKLTAILISKEFDKPVYKIELSKLVLKYIGETGKNLETVFEAAEKNNWILF